MSNNETDIEKNSNKKSVVWIICTILFVLVIIGGAVFAKTRGKASVSSPSGKLVASGTDASITNAVSKEEDEDEADEAEDEDEDEADSDSTASVGDQKQITVKWQKEEYTGIYTGGLKNDKPSGEGTFVSDDERLRYSGGWKKGKFHGSGKITYIDGSYETGSYEKGKRHGRIKEYKDEENYSVARYNEDMLYGERIYYENGGEVKTKWYYNGKPLDKIEKKAIELTNQVFDDKEYLDKTVYIEGIVAFVGETSKTEYFRIDTDSIGMVIGKYSNQLGKYTKQANLPTMKVGDKVRIYGTCSDIAKNQCINDEDCFGYDYPEIEPISGYIIESESKDKETIENRYVFEHYTRWTSEKYVVKEVLRSGKKIYIFANIYDSDSEEEYVLFFNADGDNIIREGDVIKASGYYDGQYKAIKDEEKELFENQEKRKETYYDRYSGVKIDFSRAVFTYEYNTYPAIHVYKWKKK